MAAITNLSFAELNAELASPAYSYDAGNSDILVSLKALTGETYTGLSDSKAMRAIKAIIDNGRNAQTAANVGQIVGERLDAFNEETVSLDPTTNQILVSTSLDFVLDYSNASVIGEVV